MTPSPYWDRERHADRKPFLDARAAILRAVRTWFEAQGFTEAEPAMLVGSPGAETHIDAFEIDGRYLHTSPEFAMKKLLAAGESRIFQFAPVFRAREASPLHAGEFAMLEWYRSGEDYTALMADCSDMLRLAAEIGERSVFSCRGRTCDATLEPERLSLVEAFHRHAGIDLSLSLEDRDAFAAAAAQADTRIAPDDTWSDVFSRVLSERIEPHLGVGRPTILDRYPVSEAALARPCPDDPRLAERFELYVCGVELANAFGELTDVGEQRKRFEADMAEKERIYGERYPLDEDFLAALAYMPDASGIAVGFDRLAMLAAGAEAVDDVIFTPWSSGNSVI